MDESKIGTEVPEVELFTPEFGVVIGGRPGDPYRAIADLSEERDRIRIRMRLTDIPEFNYSLVFPLKALEVESSDRVMTAALECLPLVVNTALATLTSLLEQLATGEDRGFTPYEPAPE